MLIDSKGSRAVSSLGWADRGAFIVADLEKRSSRAVKVAQSAYVSVHGGSDGYFAVQHHDNKGTCIGVTVHRFDDPDTQMASVTINADGSASDGAFQGDMTAWAKAPSAYIAHTWRDGAAVYAMVVVDPARQVVTPHLLTWFDEAFDAAYQAPAEVVRVPLTESTYAITVARDPRLFLHDSATGALARTVALADRGGAHVPIFRSDMHQAWTTDYDAVVCLDPRTWAVAHTQRLQRPAADVAMFLGPATLNPDETLCVLPRPGSGDVLGVDTDTRRVVRRAAVGLQPIEAVASLSGVVYARDWKTGAALWANWDNV